MSSLKINDVYRSGENEYVITRLFERFGSKNNLINFKDVEKVDLDNVPPPRKDLHQNRYGECEFAGKKMFMKILSPGFYKRSKRWYRFLAPYAKDLFVESHFDDEHKIIIQPSMKDTMNNIKLKKDHIERNVKKITDFLDRIKDCTNETVLMCFGRMDVARVNFMIDEKRENFYVIDFDPWAKTNSDKVWDKIIKELKK